MNEYEPPLASWNCLVGSKACLMGLTLCSDPSNAARLPQVPQGAGARVCSRVLRLWEVRLSESLRREVC